MTHEHDSHRIDTTRRTFLRGASALVATGWLAQQSFAALNQQAPQGLTGHRERPLVLVMLELTGGNDGLNAMPPQNNDIYRRERGDLAITDGFQLTETAGLHPELKGLHRLYGDGKLAIIAGVGIGTESSPATGATRPAAIGAAPAGAVGGAAAGGEHPLFFVL